MRSPEPRAETLERRDHKWKAQHNAQPAAGLVHLLPCARLKRLNSGVWVLVRSSLPKGDVMGKA